MITTSDPLPCQEDPTPFDAVLDAPSKRNVEAAKRVCRDCAHREPCVLQALANQWVGVFGGRFLLGKGKPNWLNDRYLR